jgi:hypothetical protein
MRERKESAAEGRRRFRRTTSALLPALLAAACASSPGDDEWRAAAAFIETDRTTRADLVQRLGPPHKSWENGRIAAWRVTCAQDAGLRRGDPSPFAPPRVLEALFEARVDDTRPLVVVFGADDAVSRFNLVLR